MATIFTFLISLSYAIPSILLYLLTMFVIHTNRKSFDSSYFKMYSYDCLVNLLTYFKTFSTMRLPSVTCFDCIFAPIYKNINDHLPMPFVFSTGYHFAYVQYGTTTLISLNRLTVLLNFNLFEPIWRKFGWLLMLAVFLFPFINTRVALDYYAGLGYVNSTDSFALSSKMPVWEIYTYLIPFMIVTILVSLGSNIASLVFVRNARLVNANKAESNFIIITSITCTIQLIGTVLSVGMLTLQSSSIYSVLSFFQLYVSDALTLVQPWLLLFFSNGIRGQIKRMFGCQPKTPVASSLFKNRSMTT